MYTLWHDCGTPGEVFHTEYSEIDVKEEGGIEALRKRYERAGIKIIWIEHIPE